jgi:GWxTD domain-containing protein
VVWIISDEEKKAFKNLSNDEERDAFIEQFWLRRNPDPDSPDNEFREEHYRRIAYANEHFAAGKPGWKTDRGHIYISFGKPDSIESHPSGGSYERPMEEGGGETSTFPFETWHYRYLEGIGDNIDLEFVDTCQCGDYHFTIDRSEKDALLHVPGAGETLYEQMGRPRRRTASRAGLEKPGHRAERTGNQSKQFDRIELAAKIFCAAADQVQGSGELYLRSQADYRADLPVRCAHGFRQGDRGHGAGADHAADQEPGCDLHTKDGVSKGVVNILGKVSTITHKVGADL